jgi:hypothetical protein
MSSNWTECFASLQPGIQYPSPNCFDTPPWLTWLCVLDPWVVIHLTVPGLAWAVYGNAWAILAVSYYVETIEYIATQIPCTFSFSASWARLLTLERIDDMILGDPLCDTLSVLLMMLLFRVRGWVPLGVYLEVERVRRMMAQAPSKCWLYGTWIAWTLVFGVGIVAPGLLLVDQELPTLLFQRLAVGLFIVFVTIFGGLYGIAAHSSRDLARVLQRSFYTGDFFFFIILTMGYFFSLFWVYMSPFFQCLTHQVLYIGIVWIYTALRKACCPSNERAIQHSQPKTV